LKERYTVTKNRIVYIKMQDSLKMKFFQDSHETK